MPTQPFRHEAHATHVMSPPRLTSHHSSFSFFHLGEAGGGAHSQALQLTAGHPRGPAEAAWAQLCRTNSGYWHVGGQGAAWGLEDPLPHPGWQHSGRQCPCQSMKGVFGFLCSQMSSFHDEKPLLLFPLILIRVLLFHPTSIICQCGFLFRALTCLTTLEEAQQMMIS